MRLVHPWAEGRKAIHMPVPCYCLWKYHNGSINIGWNQVFICFLRKKQNRVCAFCSFRSCLTLSLDVVYSMSARCCPWKHAKPSADVHNKIALEFVSNISHLAFCAWLGHASDRKWKTQCQLWQRKLCNKRHKHTAYIFCSPWSLFKRIENVLRQQHSILNPQTVSYIWILQWAGKRGTTHTEGNWKSRVFVKYANIFKSSGPKLRGTETIIYLNVILP